MEEEQSLLRTGPIGGRILRIEGPLHPKASSLLSSYAVSVRCPLLMESIALSGSEGRAFRAEEPRQRPPVCAYALSGTDMGI
eukprot:323858-Rhodomonas_salina.10